ASAEHRAELRAQSEAEAARTTALLRDVLAEHRAELAQAHQAHADHLAQVLAQRSQGADPPAASGDMVEMRAALANVQREANEAVAEHIDALAAIIADLGHTVGTLAVEAAQKAQHVHRSAQVTFLPPPRPVPAVHAAAPDVDPAAALRHEPPATIAVSAASSRLEPANSGPPAAASVPASPQATPAAADSPTRTSPAVSLTDAITSESPQAKAIQLKFEEAAALARLHGALEDDDNRDLETAPADDDPECHPRLAPLTDIAPLTAEPRR
ncbi:MAG: hypothetical protein H0T76_01650, partial [Nannocystis sp.]